jgi:hypothetical protein
MKRLFGADMFVAEIENLICNRCLHFLFALQGSFAEGKMLSTLDLLVGVLMAPPLLVKATFG